MQTQYNDPKGQAGSLKAPLGLVPPYAMEQTSWVHKLGADKYGPWNWRETGVCASTYVNAILRHLNAWRDGESLDPESGITHLAHIACSANILMDAEVCGKLQDDRNKRPDETEEGSPKVGASYEDFWGPLDEDTVPEYHVLLREGDKLQDGDEVYVGEDHWLPVYVSDWMTPSIVRNGTYRRKITDCDLKDKVADCDLKEDTVPEYRVLKKGELIQEGDEFFDEQVGEWKETSLVKAMGIEVEYIVLYRRKVADCDLKEDTIPEYHVLLREGDKLQDGDEMYVGGDHWLPVCISDWATPSIVRNGNYRRKITNCDLKDKVANCDLEDECKCGRRKVYHWLFGHICEDCDLKSHDSYYP